jgi:hypothetical protein
MSWSASIATPTTPVFPEVPSRWCSTRTTLGLAKSSWRDAEEHPNSALMHHSVANRHRREHPTSNPTSPLARPYQPFDRQCLRKCEGCASCRLGLLQLRDQLLLGHGRRPWSRYDAMRHPRSHSHIIFAAGCANGWFPPVSPPATALASSVGASAADCSAKASSPFGAGANASSLNAVIDDPARNSPAAQSCAWEKGTRISYGSPTLTTGALAERK